MNRLLWLKIILHHSESSTRVVTWNNFSDRPGIVDNIIPFNISDTASHSNERSVDTKQTVTQPRLAHTGKCCPGVRGKVKTSESVPYSIGREPLPPTVHIQLPIKNSNTIPAPNKEEKGDGNFASVVHKL